MGLLEWGLIISLLAIWLLLEKEGDE